jgi:uncharacterized BrkB/YihY/UPF0761 family membrane protein
MHLGTFLMVLYFGFMLPLMLLLYGSRPDETIETSDNVAAVVIAVVLALPTVAAFAMFYRTNRCPRQRR